jgi:hypothetical protein
VEHRGDTRDALEVVETPAGQWVACARASLWMTLGFRGRADDDVVVGLLAVHQLRLGMGCADLAGSRQLAELCGCLAVQTDFRRDDGDR